MQTKSNFSTKTSYYQSFPASTNNQIIKFSKLDFNFILSMAILVFLIIIFTLHNIFIVNLKSHIEKEMVNMIMSNQTLIDNKQCKKLLTTFTLEKFKLNLENYESHKDYLYYTNTTCMGISFTLSVCLIFLIKFRKNAFNKFFKKAAISFAIIFAVIEYVSILFYLSIYLKSFHMYTFIENTLFYNKCFRVEGFEDLHETIVYKVFVNTFLPEAKFVYSCAAVLVMLHFGILIVVIYKIKLLIMINIEHLNCDSTFFSCIERSDCMEMTFISPEDSLIKYRNNLNGL
jgi:hypothetical protein